jgi:predicted Ser/Thr protein kinase
VADPKMPAKLGRYEVVRELGKGAMGVVYEGKDPNIGRRVAIKTARREVVEASGMADEMMERFLREAKAAGALNHPNIITIYDAAEEEGMAYIAMEYLEGGDLADIVDSRKRLGMEEIVEIGANICEALHVAHEHGVVHRDIKPANILMPKDKPLKVADFGIAHVSDSNLTQDGALIGTPHYMSPEQFMGQKLDGRSDLFSVGNILYELTTGEKPFGGEALSTVMHRVIKIDPVSPTELNFAIPDALAGVIMKALSKRPANRFKTGNEMAAALRESLKENPNPAILDPGANIALTSTMAAPAAAAPVQATMITPPVSEDAKATIAGARPASQETTIAEPGPGATVPGGPPAPGATVAGPPPAPAPTADVGATIPGSAPAHIQSLPATTSGPSKGVLIGGGIAVAIVVVIGGILMTGGDKTPPASSTTPPTNSATPVENTAATTDRFYTSVIFEIFRANTEDGYKRFMKKEATLDDLAGELSEVAGTISIELVDAAGNIIASAPTWSVGDLIEIPSERKVGSMNYRIRIVDPDKPGSEEMHRGEIEAATEPDATANIPIIFAPATGG